MRATKRFHGYFYENGLGLTLLRVVELFIGHFRSMYYSKSLKASELKIGRHAKIRGARFMHFGTNFQVGHNVWIEAISAYGVQQFEPSVEFGDDVLMMNQVHIACINSVRVGNGVLFGSNILITDHAHGKLSERVPPALRGLTSKGSVTIGDNVWIGDNVCILPSVNIGVGAVIGAGSVVTSDVPDYSVVAGIPAKVISKEST